MVCTDIFSKQSEQDSSLSAATKTFQQVGSLNLKRLRHEIYSNYRYLFSKEFHMFFSGSINLLSQKILEFIFLLIRYIKILGIVLG
jgi:hypothetical protein